MYRDRECIFTLRITVEKSLHSMSPFAVAIAAAAVGSWYVFRISVNRFHSYSNKYILHKPSLAYNFHIGVGLMVLSHVNDHKMS